MLICHLYIFSVRRLLRSLAYFLSFLFPYCWICGFLCILDNSPLLNVFWRYSWPWNNAGIEGPNSMQSKSCVVLQVEFCIYSSSSMDLTNHGSCILEHVPKWRKKKYKCSSKLCCSRVHCIFSYDLLIEFISSCLKCFGEMSKHLWNDTLTCWFWLTWHFHFLGVCISFPLLL